MFNVNQITAELARMPDHALQQYAALHKSDPYTVALALAESNRRKELRAGSHMQMGEQPKVVDQEIAGIAQAALPENVGIGQLPAQNIQRMAGGGIVAFDKGGEVPRYYDGVLVKQKDVQKAYDDWIASQPSWYQQKTPTSGQREATAKAEYERLLKAYQTQPNLSQPGAALAPKTEVSGIDLGGKGGSPATTGAPIAPKKEQSGIAKLVDTTATDTVKADKKQPAPAQKGVAALDSAYRVSTPEELGKSAKTLAAEANKESEAAYSPYAEMLKKEREELGGRKSENFNMALLQAGLGMMGGTSPNAFANIGAGATKGVDYFASAQRADDAAKKALMGSEIALMQAQRAERSGNHKDAVALIGQAEQSKQFGITSALKAKELEQMGAYQQGMIGVQQGRNEMLRDAYGLKEKDAMSKFTKQAMESLVKSDPLWGTYTPAVQQQKIAEATRGLLMASPYAHLAGNIGFSAQPTNPGLVRQLTKSSEE